MLQTPEFIAIGHTARDMHSDGTFSPGGTVTFATLTASRLGLTTGIVTRADLHFISELASYLPGVALQVSPSSTTTTFVNQYSAGFRTQYLRERAALLEIKDIPKSWCQAPIVLLGPLAQEIGPDIVALFPRRPEALIAATPQGWLRRWDADGRVWPTLWQTSPQILPLLDILILSHDDLLPFVNEDRSQAERMLHDWSTQVPLLVATDGHQGATLFQQGKTKHFPAYPANEVDPTGAGDVFAAAFLTDLYKHKDPDHAVNFANCVASLSIEQEGIKGIPTLQMVEARLQNSKLS